MKRGILLAISLCVPAMVWAQKVSTDFDESVDFSKFHTYAWRKGRIQSKNPSLDSTLVDKHIVNAVNRRLAAKRLQEVTAKPDLVVTYMVGARDQKEVETYPSGWRRGGRRRVVRQYTQDTLVIDLKDAASTQLVWRAVCTDAVSDPAKFERRLEATVAKAFDKYPPKKKR